MITARHGRTKRHYLNPVPIEQVANRWISKYAARFTAALVALDDQVIAGHGNRRIEEGRTGMSLTAHVYQIYIAASAGASLVGDHRVRVDQALLPYDRVRRAPTAGDSRTARSAPTADRPSTA